MLGHRFPINYPKLQDIVRSIQQPTSLDLIGLVGDECFVIKRPKKLDKIKFEGILHHPYQLVYLEDVYGADTDWILPHRPDSISHLCGDKRCVNASHMLCEPLNRNNERKNKCHDVIRKYRDKHSGSIQLFSKLTMMDVCGHPCRHSTQCFISYGTH